MKAIVVSRRTVSRFGRHTLLTGSLTALLALTGCATPEIVAERQLGDADLSCAQIMNEMNEVNTLKASAQADKGVSGKNVAAFLVFWPAIIGNEMNTSKAIEAANRRSAYLAQAYDDQGCGGSARPARYARVGG